MNLDFLEWIEHAGFMLRIGSSVAYIDPFRLNGKKERADVVFITHPHFDHLSVKDIDKVAGPSTLFVAPKGSEEQLAEGTVASSSPGRSMR